jgi:hypothetical protein
MIFQLDQVDLNRTPITPDYERLKELSRLVHRELKMDLFGIDVTFTEQSISATTNFKLPRIKKQITG